MAQAGMYSDITTPENRLRAKRDYQKYLRRVLNAAASMYNQLNENERAKALKAVCKINSIRHQLYEKAMELGYVKRCIDAMPVCKGQCCKWHFPKRLNYLDLFITICSISSEEQKALEDQIAFDNGKYQCPLLCENGCSLSFGSRPLACSNAYPCFLGDSYYEFLENQRKEMNIQHMLLEEVLRKSRGALKEVKRGDGRPGRQARWVSCGSGVRKPLPRLKCHRYMQEI